jgi:hypothetical protein
MQSAQPNILSSSSYGLPLSSVLASNPMAGLGMYGSGVSTVPSYGYSSGQTTVYNVPGKEKNTFKNWIYILFL